MTKNEAWQYLLQVDKALADDLGETPLADEMLEDSGAPALKGNPQQKFGLKPYYEIEIRDGVKGHVDVGRTQDKRSRVKPVD